MPHKRFPPVRVSREGFPEVSLTYREYQLLVALVRSSPAYCPSEWLGAQVWGDHLPGGTNPVGTLLQGLRRKLPVVETSPNYGGGWRIPRVEAGTLSIGGGLRPEPIPSARYARSGRPRALPGRGEPIRLGSDAWNAREARRAQKT